MRNVLAFGNFEINFRVPPDQENVDRLLEKKEEAIFEFLKTLGGDVESFEFEGFGYGNGDEGNAPRHYYYNKQENDHKRV